MPSATHPDPTPARPGVGAPAVDAAWRLLAEHHQAIGQASMSEAFAADPGRFDALSLDAAGLFLDYSKHRIDRRTMPLLAGLARACGLEPARDAMFAGERINATEGRAVLHVALRDPDGGPLTVDGRDVRADVRDVLARMARFCDAVRAGGWTGRTGQAITDVVNIGIGGSDLGPLMACEALNAFAHPRLRMHFVSNIDGAHLHRVLARCQADTTLFIIASKTFTTLETLTNAHSARRWFLAQGAAEPDIARHFVAVSTNGAKVAGFGIDPANMFGFWDWVGGRYSMWSAVGLPVMLSIGPARFRELLDGARAMDRHFRSAPLERNLPVILAMLGIWYRNFQGCASASVAPYAQDLHRLPAYLQQLEMESNGKSVRVDGGPLTVASCPVIWGEPGTNGQHAFFQLLHQGTDLIPVDFILPVAATHPLDGHQRLLAANCIAQSEALLRGKTEGLVREELAAAGLARDAIDVLAPHKVFAGNRPSTMLLMPRLDPASLGALIAAYEHKVFAQSVVWGVNAFDQWGVELGKQLATRIADELAGAPRPDRHEASTNGLIRRVAAGN